jgi:hypothetical protein
MCVRNDVSRAERCVRSMDGWWMLCGDLMVMVVFDG